MRRRMVGLAAGPALCAVVLLLPLPGLSREAHVLAAIYLWTIVWWATETLPLAVTALLASALAIVGGVAPAAAVLAPYADPIVFLFIGSFVLAEGLRRTGLDRRLAFGFLRRGWATRTPGRTLLALGVVTCVLSLWVSNTATTVIMLPIGLGVLAALGRAGDISRSRFPIGLVLMLAWASSVAVGVPVGSPPNLIAIAMVRDLTMHRLTFFDWVAVTLPLTGVMLALTWLTLRRRYVSAADAAAGDDLARYVAAERARLGPWTRAELNVAGVFAIACTLWLLPGALALVAGAESTAARALERHLPESVVALLAAVALFVLPARGGEPTLAWSDASRIDWGTILLFGGGLSLGRLMFETGLAAAFGRAIVDVSGAESVWSLTAVAIVLGIALSEVSSNTASATMVIPVVISVAQGAGVSPVPPAIGAALGASFGFMLPVSTPPNAVVFGSGLVPLREMIRAGAVLDLVGAALIWLGLRVLCPLFGVM